MNFLEIRAWHRVEKRMIEEIDQLHNMSLCNTYWEVRDGTDGPFVTDVDLMLFTGRFARGGKKIFESDVVFLTPGGEKFKGFSTGDMGGLIVWDEKLAGFVIEWTLKSIRRRLMKIDREPIFSNSEISLEVIGDVYRTPVLLKLFKDRKK